MAALFLLRGSPFYSSCSFVKLFLGSMLKSAAGLHHASNRAGEYLSL
ncbi:hypothetical protein L917_19065 [Phytophthora nicotianae]|uniref:Uncharacterized protein n=1 Tax=Phytophthora nicotianae TaxID=4792 RepID=W2K7A7_PHYNI|nr:hypothetical protein L917_19065 [Phytophthora nicotianae]